MFHLSRLRLKFSEYRILGLHAVWQRMSERVSRAVFRILLRSWQFSGSGRGIDGLVYYHGGLGNQMFTYAFHRRLQLLHPQRRIVADSQNLDAFGVHNGFELERVFGLNFERVPAAMSNRFQRLSIRARCVREPEYSSCFAAGFLAEDFPAYFLGYWQSSAYFQEIRGTLLAEFCFSEPGALPKNMGYPTCSLHVRRGDYLKPNSAFSGICTDAYYEAAIAAVCALDPEVRFFVFSNDLEWCRERFAGEKFILVEANPGSDSWRDMQMMSLCNHHIVANSSFSWWGAWLDIKQGGVVFCPSLFTRGDKAEEIARHFYPKEWIRIDFSGNILGAADAGGSHTSPDGCGHAG